MFLFVIFAAPQLVKAEVVDIECGIMGGQYKCQQKKQTSQSGTGVALVSNIRCPATCGIRNETCDQLFHRDFQTCEELEKIGCDCGGCNCDGDDLHPDWMAAINQSNGKVFYYNGQTLETSWAPRSENVCPKTCRILGDQYSCDALWLDYTCEHLELGGCDCSGCDCKATTLSIYLASRPNSEDECERTCSVPGGFHTYSCNDLQWLYADTTCAILEERGCDCSGCLCENENTMIDPNPPLSTMPPEMHCPGTCKLHGGRSNVAGFGFTCDQLYFLYSFSREMSCEALEESGCDCTGCRCSRVKQSIHFHSYAFVSANSSDHSLRICMCLHNCRP